MRATACLLAAAVFAAVVSGLRLEPEVSPSTVLAAPPLSLEGFLDEKLPEAPKDAEEVLADNSSCYVCHENYNGESLVMMHATEDVGCVDCHGPSHAHRDDEDNITPPDIMYPARKIAPGCAECHDTHDAPARKVIALWQERCPAKTNPDDLLCTDCHGEHRLKFRTVWWDRETRELILRKEGQLTKPRAATTAPAGVDPEKTPAAAGG